MSRTAWVKIANEEIEQVTVKEDIRCSEQVKCRISLVKEALNRKKRLLCGSLDTKLKKRLMKYFACSVLFYGGDTWILTKQNESRFQEMCIRDSY